MSSKKQTFKGKKWCEYCKTGINWTKEDIAYHEQSRTHKKNVEREVEFKRQKIIREQEQAKQGGVKIDETAQMIQEIERKAEEAMQNSSKQSQNQKRYFDNKQIQGGNLIGPQAPQQHKEIELTEEQKKELKRLKKKEELGSEFGSSYEESDTDEGEEQFSDDEVDQKNSFNKVDFAQKFDRVWYLSKDEKTGKLFFYNQLSGQRKYEKPIGLKLLEEEQILWDDYLLQQLEEQEREEEQELEATNKKIKEYHKNKDSENQNDKEQIQNAQEDEQNQKIQVNDQEGVIQSGWVEVTEEDNFFNKYAVRNVHGNVARGNKEGEESDDDIDDDEVAKMARIELLIEQGKIETKEQMIQALLEGSEGGNVKKQNEKMKNLIEKNLDIQQDINLRVYKKKNWLEEDDDQNQNNKQVQKPSVSIQSSTTTTSSSDQHPKSEIKGSLFKKRINNNKNVQNIPVDD